MITTSIDFKKLYELKVTAVKYHEKRFKYNTSYIKFIFESPELPEPIGRSFNLPTSLTAKNVFTNFLSVITSKKFPDHLLQYPGKLVHHLEVEILRQKIIAKLRLSKNGEYIDIEQIFTVWG